MSKKNDEKTEKLAFPATVVGGRPAKRFIYNKKITSMEILIAFASRSVSTQKSFIENPLGFAGNMGVELTENEKKMLEKTDEAGLNRMVTALRQSGSVTRRFILAAGVSALTALAGLCVYVPYVSYAGIMAERLLLHYEIKKISNVQNIGKEEIRELLEKNEYRLEDTGEYIIEYFHLKEPFNLQIGLKIIEGIAQVESFEQDFKPELNEKESEFLYRILVFYAERICEDILLYDGAAFTVTILFTPIIK